MAQDALDSASTSPFHPYVLDPTNAQEILEPSLSMYLLPKDLITSLAS